MVEASKLLKEMIAAGVAEPVQETDPTVNPEFQNLLDEQSSVSYDELKKAIQRDGIRDPIVLWAEQNTVIDGHNRLKIAKELGIPCPSKGLSFKDDSEVKEWIIRNQLGRRNLTPARFEYYIGKLYNEQKMVTTEEKLASKGGQKTDEKLAKEFEVSPKTVRRYGTNAKAVDYLEKIRGKTAKAAQLSAKPTYTAEELAAVASASNSTSAAKVLTHLDTFKKATVEKKAVAKKQQAAIVEKATLYNVVLAKPEFASPGFNVTTEPKPTLDKEAAVYMVVPDEYLSDGMKLIERWGLVFEASVIFYSNKTYVGQWTKIAHTFVLIASKGQMALVQAGKEAVSVSLVNGEIDPHVIKLIETYHPNGGSKKLDMRRGAAAVKGWDQITK